MSILQNKNITCEQYLCLYFEDYSCLLESININELGFCEDCIKIDIPESDIKRYKLIHRNKLKNRYKQ